MTPSPRILVSLFSTTLLLFLFACGTKISPSSQDRLPSTTQLRAEGMNDMGSTETSSCQESLKSWLDSSAMAGEYFLHPQDPSKLVLNAGSECKYWSDEGVAACKAISQEIGYELLVFSDDPEGKALCGCQCASPDVCYQPGDNPESPDYFANGSGTQEEPYRIYNKDQIRDISQHVSALGNHYLQCADISLENSYSLSSPYFTIGANLAPFTGSYDGNGHTISHFEYQELPGNPIYPDPTNGTLLDVDGVPLRSTKHGVGFFGKTSGATVKNLRFQHTRILTPSARHVGGVIGRSENTTLHDVQASGSIRGYDAVGGTIGIAEKNSTLSNLSSSGSVTSEMYRAGGLVGWMLTTNFSPESAVMSHSENHATVTGKHGYAGGLVGETDFNVLVQHSLSTGDVIGGEFSEFVGGLIGLANRSTGITHSYATGAVSGRQFVGGLVGRTGACGSGDSIDINNSFFNGTVSITVKYAGGIVGYSTGCVTIVDAYAAGEVLYEGLYPGTNSGGIMGYGAGTIENAAVLSSLIEGAGDPINEIGTYTPLGFTVYDQALECPQCLGQSNATALPKSDILNLINTTWDFGPNAWTWSPGTNDDLPYLPSAGLEP